MTTKRKLATAIADLDKGVVLARVDIAVPPERVFRALTTDEFAQWWGAPELYRTTKHSIDLRVGGAWKSEGIGADGSPFHVGGEVLELDPPRLLVQTWRPSWDSETTTVAYALDATPTGTRVTVRHSGFVDPTVCDGHAEGWERVFGWLGAHLEVPARYFLCRLMPPRATFMQDMTADERAIMGAHGRYWRAKLADGVAIAFGPVVDPAGGYGLGIMKADDESALAAHLAGDPAVAAPGFRYETLPMASAVY